MLFIKYDAMLAASPYKASYGFIYDSLRWDPDDLT